MFIIEHRTAGVLAALVIAAVVTVVSSVWDQVGEPAVQSSATATAAATSVGPERDSEVIREHGKRSGTPVTRTVEVPQGIDPLTANN